MPNDNHADEDGQIRRSGWLIKSREPLMKLPLFRSKWVRRYCVLRFGCLPNQCRLDQYENERKKKPTKVLKLDDCTQVDSYLRLSHTNEQKEWIFAMHIKNRELYFAAEAEEEMNAWVKDLCFVCNLEREENSLDSIQYEVPSCVDLVPSVSHDSILDTPTTENKMFEKTSRCESEEEKEESHLHKIVFPDGGHLKQTEDKYLHLSGCSSSNLYEQEQEGKEQLGVQAKNGYVLLTRCVTAQPRPHKDSQVWEGASGGDSSIDSSDTAFSLSDTESTSNCASLTYSNHQSASTLDAVMPPPRPAKGERHNYWNEEERGESIPMGYDALSPNRYNLLNRKPPPAPPVPEDEQDHSSAETIKLSNEEEAYLNLCLSSSGKAALLSAANAPLIDRSTKPNTTHPSKKSSAQTTTVRINRIDSFVKRQCSSNSSACQASQPSHVPPRSYMARERKTPAMLPITSPKNRMTPKQLQTLDQSMESGAGEFGDRVKYLEPAFGGPASPAPNQVAESVKVNYLVIDPKRTKAIEETIVKQQVSRTLDRKDRNKHY